MNRQYRGATVSLAVYDLSPANDCLCAVGFGVYHSGVRLGNTEWTFSDDGIFSHAPGEVGQDIPVRDLVNLGELKVDNRAVEMALDELRAAFPSGSYHLVKQNCNHFSAAFLERLGFRPPGWVNRLAWCGSWWPYWPPMGGTTDGASSGSGSAAPAVPRFTAFGAGGQVLGSRAVAVGSGDAMSERETRAAAIEARMARMSAAAEADKKSA